MPFLRVLHPHQPEESYPLLGKRITVGRRPDNTIQIFDPSVSARHAELVLSGDHYRLHDLESTNLSFVEGAAVTDYHLHRSCKITFGNVQCEFVATSVGVLGATEQEPGLTADHMEKDLAFLRSENHELLSKISQLQRQIDILASARLVTGRADGAQGDANLTEIKRLREERDAARYENSGLQLEVSKLREELEITCRERDLARRGFELLQGERIAQRDELNDQVQNSQTTPREDDKGATQRIVFPVPPVPAGVRM